MAAEVFGGLVTIGATATSLYALLGAVSGLPPSALERVTSNVLCFRAKDDNAGTVYFEKSNGNQLGWINASESLSIDTQLVRVDISNILLSGTVGDKVYVMGLEY